MKKKNNSAQFKIHEDKLRHYKTLQENFSHVLFWLTKAHPKNEELVLLLLKINNDIKLLVSDFINRPYED